MDAVGGKNLLAMAGAEPGHIYGSRPGHTYRSEPGHTYEHPGKVKTSTFSHNICVGVSEIVPFW